MLSHHVSNDDVCNAVVELLKKVINRVYIPFGNSSSVVFLSLIMKKNSSTLDGLFLDEDSPYALSGNVQELLGAARVLGVPRPTAQTYLRSEPTFTLHRLQLQRFPRSKTVVGPSVNHTWQVNLVELSCANTIPSPSKIISEDTVTTHFHW